MRILPGRRPDGTLSLLPIETERPVIRELAYPENAPSIRIMQKLGMRDAGMVDAYVHGCAAQRWDQIPSTT